MAEKEKIPPGKKVQKTCWKQACGRAGEGDPVRACLQEKLQTPVKPGSCSGRRGRP